MSKKTQERQIDRVANTSADLLAESVAQIKVLFPQAVTEGKVDFDKLRQALADETDDRPERYSFTWAGKRDAIRLLQTPSRATLVPAPKESINFDSTNNVFIEGENLEVLKVLYKSYAGRVKMIYIDPPYNTGNDFIYPDNFADPLDTYLKLTGQKDSEGNLLTSNPETSGRYHSAWLTMMYPRLFVARQLLSEDGVLAVSIDDYEVYNLRALLNELFGDDGFLGTFVWRRRISSSMASSWISGDHEYVLLYSKNPEAVFVRGDERDMSKYCIPDEKGRLYASMPLTVGMTKQMRPNQWYELKNPKTGTGYWPPVGRVWGFYPPTMQEKIKQHRIIWPEDYPDRNMTTPRIKTYPEDAKRDRKPVSTWIAEMSAEQDAANSDVVSLVSARNEEGTRVLKDLFGESVFPYPKPLSLLTTLADQFSRENDIVMDFFAGSATFAHAVLVANREGREARRFICVQLPEPTDSKDYPTLADVAKERVRRVIKKFKEEPQGKLDLKERDAPEDLGFRVFKLDESNYRPWKGVESKDGAAYADTMEMFTDPLLPGWKPLPVIYEVALKEGYSLTCGVEELKGVAGSTVYRVTDADRGQSFLICLDDKFKAATVKALGLKKDDLFICRDVALTDEQAANLALQCRLKTI